MEWRNNYLEKPKPHTKVFLTDGKNIMVAYWDTEKNSWYKGKTKDNKVIIVDGDDFDPETAIAWGEMFLPPTMIYNPDFGDDKLCKCGHTYYRHFDTYENMYPIGCKYCYDCPKFEEK